MTILNFKRQIFAVLSVALLGLNTHALTAEELPQPVGEPLLTVSGAITNTNADGVAIFDLNMLASLRPTEFSTSTIWTDEPHTFTGIELHEVLDLIGVEGTILRATALNDYAVDIPISDAVEGGPIIAYLFDGKTMSTREKGPLWIVYPYDLDERYQTEQIYSRSIWQLDRLEILE